MINMTSSTDLKIIRETPARFTWGAVQYIHDIGPYTIVEYTDKNNGATMFQVYVNGKSTSNSTATLDGAILLAVAWRNLGASEAPTMARGACRLLGVKE